MASAVVFADLSVLSFHHPCNAGFGVVGSLNEAVGLRHLCSERSLYIWSEYGAPQLCCATDGSSCGDQPGSGQLLMDDVLVSGCDVFMVSDLRYNETS